MSELAQPLPGGSTWLSRRASVLALVHLEAYRRLSAARDGGAGRLTGELEELLAALRMSATGAEADIERTCLCAGQRPDGLARGHADMDPAATSAPWCSDDELLPLKEAAEMLGVSDRHVRRRAAAGELGPVERSGRVQFLRRSVVIAAIEATGAVTNHLEQEA